MKPFVALVASVALCTSASQAAPPRDLVVDLKAAVSDTSPYITLSWTQPAALQSSISTQKMYRRAKNSATWTLLSNLTNTDTSYIDTTAAAATEYEYWMERKFTGVTPNVAMGYLSAGSNVPEIQTRGILLLVIDNTMVIPLAAEIELLKSDLAADGWTVRTLSVPRSGTAADTKLLIKAVYDENPANTRSLFLLGRVPVPYSGNIFPDGHGDHYGAWPADGYYGDFDGVWTDSTVDNISASSTRNQNKPGDGKFDQSSFPSPIELEIGRVDLAGMNRAPSSGVSEVSRLRRYLRQAHDFRHKLNAYSAIPRRSIIRDGFGHFNNSEPFSIQGWSTALSSVGPTIDVPGNGQWFTPAFASGKDYLFGHGCGGGSYDSASNFGTSRDFGTKASRVVFTSLFGSYFGDWAADNNLMRAAICGNAEGTSLGLTCFWSGRPHWFTHQPGMGETWGYATRTSMNAAFNGVNGYVPGGSSFRGVHMGLMGDPALRLHVVEPPRALAATSSGGNVSLTWAASTESGLAGYHVYRAASPAGPFTQLTSSPLATPAYTDATAPSGASSTYLVKTLKLESVPGGSYYNLSIGSAVSLTPSAGATPGPSSPSDLTAILTPPQVLAGYYKFDGTAIGEPADFTTPGFTASITKSTESRGGGGSDDRFYGDSRILSGPGSDGFLRMTGNFTATINHGGSSPYVLDRFLFDATSISAGALLNVSYSINEGTPVSLTTAAISLPVSTASDTETRPYGSFGLAIPNATLNPGDTIVFAVSLAAGNGRLDNIGITARPSGAGSSVDLAWSDNSTGETGFRIERKSSASGSFVTIATLASNIRTFTDSNAPNHDGVYIYRIIATGSTDSAPSNEALFEPIAGIVEFEQSAAKYDKVGGTANIPVNRVSGSYGPVTVSFATSNSSATAATHYTHTTGTVSWADGESGTKYIAVPLLPAPSLPRQFKVTLTNPAGGLGLGMRYIHSALIEDSAATLEAPWTSGTIGTITNISRAVNGDGAIGEAIIGGSPPDSGDTSETGAFTHQTRTGDGTIVVKVRGVSPSQTASRFGVMIRATLDTNSPMAVTIAASSTSTGSKFMYRETVGGAVAVPSGTSWPGNANAIGVPCWLRLTRLGNFFYSEASTNGTTWTYLASQTINGFPPTAYWGIYHTADGLYSNLLGDFQLAAYENAAVGSAILPPVPGNFSIDPATGAVSISWQSHPLATSYQIDRRGDDGSETSFTGLTGTTYNDTTPLADTAYDYRILAVTSGGRGPLVAYARLVTPAVTASPLRSGFFDSAPIRGTGIVLSWFDPSAAETSIEIERKAIHGQWAPLTTLPANSITFSDTSPLPGVHYHYRIRNRVSAEVSSWATRTPMPNAPAVVAPGTATPYQLWLLSNLLPMDESGSGNATASPSDGSPPLLIKYALGLAPSSSHYAGRLSQGNLTDSGQTYHTFSYTHPDPAPADLTYTVERSPDLADGSWRSDGLVLVGSSTSAGLKTVTVRTESSLAASTKQFLRLKILRAGP